MIKSFERGFFSERRSARPDSHREKAGNNNQGRGAPPGPPGDDQLKSRVEALEKVLPEIRERLVRVETRLDGIEQTMATKMDLGDLKVSMAELKAAMIEGFNNQTKWFVATAAVMAGTAFAAARLIH